MKNSKKICVAHVIIGLDVGGAESFLAQLVNSRTEHADTTHIIISLTTIGKIGIDLRAAGIRVEALGWSGVLSTPQMIWRLVRTLRVAQPNIVQTWMYHANVFAGIIAKILGINVVWCIHTTFLPASAPILTKILRRAGGTFSRFIPSAVVYVASAARSAHESIGYVTSKGELIPNGIDFEKFFTVKAACNPQHLLGLPQGIVTIGMVGRDSPDKDPMNFIEAISRVLDTGREVVGILIGKGFVSTNKQLISIIEKKGYENQFRLYGPMDNIAQVLACMDVFVLPSQTEGCPMVLVEAMATARICITTNVGDAAVILGGCGFVVPPREPAHLAAAIIRALDLTQEDKQSLRFRARERALKKYSLDIAREKYTSIYRRLAS